MVFPLSLKYAEKGILFSKYIITIYIYIFSVLIWNKDKNKSINIR